MQQRVEWRGVGGIGVEKAVAKKGEGWAYWVARHGGICRQMRVRALLPTPTRNPWLHKVTVTSVGYKYQHGDEHHQCHYMEEG